MFEHSYLVCNDEIEVDTVLEGMNKSPWELVSVCIKDGRFHLFFKRML